MLHSRVRFLFLVLSLACLATARADGGPKVGLLLKGRNGFWIAVEKGARATASQAGIDLVVKAPISESDIGVQVQMLNSLAAQGVDAIVIAPGSKDTLAVPLASIAVKGVKIVVIDTALSSKTGSVFIGTNHEAAGRAAGRLLASLVRENDEVTFLKHSQTSGATGQREVGALAAYREVYPKSLIHGDIYAAAEAGGELQKAELVLTQYPATKAILASSTPGTLAMLKTLRDKNLAGSVKLVGFGFNLNPEVAAAIESGALSGWIAQLPQEIGDKGITAALRLLKGETMPAVIYTDFIVITKENLHDPKVEALLKL